jgi:hypothetical protein
LGIIDPRRRYARGHDVEGVYGDPADGHVTLDHASGRLETVAEELFDGLLPEGPAFDTQTASSSASRCSIISTSPAAAAHCASGS